MCLTRTPTADAARACPPSWAIVTADRVSTHAPAAAAAATSPVTNTSHSGAPATGAAARGAATSPWSRRAPSQSMGRSAGGLRPGIPVVELDRPDEPADGHGGAPGDREDAVATDRGAEQQPTQRLHHRRERLVLGEQAHRRRHRV